MKFFNIELNNKIRITFLGIKISLKRSGKYRIEHLLCKLFAKFCKVDKNKIVFSNPLTQQFACNPKYLALELLKRDIDNLDLVWLYNSSTKKDLIPKKFRLVSYDGIRVLYELMTARLIIANSHINLPLKKGWIKSKDTFYLQTWHGSMGIKKCDNDAADVYKKTGEREWQIKSSSLFDFIPVDSDFEKQIYTTQHRGFAEIEILGKARDCIFYMDNKAIIEEVKNYYNIPLQNKILLYAPTWRPDKRNYCYNIDIISLKKALKKRFSGEWSILIRAHIRIKEEIFAALYDDREIINVSKYPDMQELLVASDILISDYSSCIPEYTILKKPSFIYAADMDEYNNNNGFYYPLNTLPSPIATDNYELINNILNFDEELFKQRAEEFLIKMGHKDDENSCKRIVDFILEKKG